MPGTRGQRITRRFLGFLLRLFYRSVRVAHADRIPTTAPLVVCANHHGSLVDPLAVIATFNRTLHPLAKAPLFRFRAVRPFLDALGALPVFRPQDRHIIRGDNRDLMAACRDALARGRALLIFPEGMSRPQTTLAPLRPGAARIALEAEAGSGWSLGVQLLPVAIHITESARFRRGRVFVEIGEPISAAEHRGAHESEPDRAVSELLNRVAESLRAMLIEVESADEVRLLRVAARAWAAEEGAELDHAGEVRRARTLARGYHQLLARDPGRAADIRIAVESYADTLAHFRLSDTELDARRTTGSVARFLVREGMALVFGAPLGLAGAALNWLPYRAAAIVGARYSGAADSWATASLLAGLALFPLYWLAVASVVGITWGAAASLATVLLLPSTGMWAVRFRESSSRARAQVRGFLLLAGGAGLERQLRAQRRSIYDKLMELGQGAGAAPATEPGAPELRG